MQIIILSAIQSKSETACNHFTNSSIQCEVASQTYQCPPSQETPKDVFKLKKIGPSEYSQEAIGFLITSSPVKIIEGSVTNILEMKSSWDIFEINTKVTKQNATPKSVREQLNLPPFLSREMRPSESGETLSQISEFDEEWRCFAMVNDCFPRLIIF